MLSSSILVITSGELDEEDSDLGKRRIFDPRNRGIDLDNMMECSMDGVNKRWVNGNEELQNDG